MKYGFGVDLGGTTVKIACLNKNGDMLEKWEIPTVTAGSGGQILPDIAASVLDYCRRENLAPDTLLGIGIGVPGAVDRAGNVNKCINLGWDRFNICQELGRLTGLRVVAGNDATVAALGECWKGGGQGCKNMIMVTLGTGVGGGIVVDGNVVHGTHGAGGEIGHMVLNRQETESCGCGKRGCVEQYCSATGIVRLTKKHIAGTDSCLLDNENFTCKDVFDAAKAGDIPAQKALEQVYAYLGEFLANVCNVTDPEAVVLGGGVSKAGATLIEGIAPYFDSYLFHACRGIRLTLATLGNDAGAYGAFRLLLNEYT